MSRRSGGFADDLAEAGPRGICFTAGTKISTPDGQENFEDLRVGDRVRTTDTSESKPEGWTEVDPHTWRKVTLRMPNPDGSDDTIDVVLLRSVDWIEQTGAEGGKWIDFGLPEMGLYGKALVVAIDACPTIEDGPGRVVLATVTHFNVEVLELKLEGLETPVEPTARHRLFSQDRQAWIPAGELRVGERIRTRTGTARIESIRKKPGIHRVYNLEVETDHSYDVSDLELLSHNDNPCAADASLASQYKEMLARQEFAEQARWKPASPAHGDELLHHAWERHPSLATNEYGVIDPKLYDARARANVVNMDSELHSIGGTRYAAFNPNTGEFTIFSWEGGGGLSAGTPTIHSYYVPIRNLAKHGSPFNSSGVVRMFDIRP